MPLDAQNRLHAGAIGLFDDDVDEHRRTRTRKATSGSNVHEADAHARDANGELVGKDKSRFLHATKRKISKSSGALRGFLARGRGVGAGAGAGALSSTSSTSSSSSLLPLASKVDGEGDGSRRRCDDDADDADDEAMLIPSTPASTASFVSARSAHVNSKATISSHFGPAAGAMRDELDVGGAVGGERRGIMLGDCRDEGAHRGVCARGVVVGIKSPWFEACGVVLVETESMGGGVAVGREVVFV